MPTALRPGLLIVLCFVCGHRSPAGLDVTDDVDVANLEDTVPLADVNDDESSDVPVSSGTTPDCGNEDTQEHLEPGVEYALQHVTRNQLCLKWHLCFGHMHFDRVAKMHRYADGVLKIPIATDLDTCPVCAATKLRKAS